MTPRPASLVALAVCLAALLCAVPGAAQAPLGDLAAWASLEDLGRLLPWEVRQVSGYDQLSPLGAPENSPPQDAEGRYVLLDAAGPGCVTRLWGHGLSGRLMIWLDGDTEPRWQGTWSEFTPRWWDDVRYRLQARPPRPEPSYLLPFAAPLADESRGLQLLTVPLAFRERCRILTDTAPANNHWCVDYLLAPGAEVRPLDPAGLSVDASPLREAVALWQRPQRPQEVSPQWQYASQRVTLGPGETTTLLYTAGAGQVRHLRVETAQIQALAGRALVLRAYWDGAEEPLLEMPLGDLAGMGFALGNPNVPAGVHHQDFTTFYCRLPMPFGDGARLTLTNESPWLIAGFTWKLWWDPLPAGAPGYARLGGFTQRLSPGAEAQELELLNLPGAGHLVGYNMAVWDVDWEGGPLRWYARGFLDGEDSPRLQGAPFFDFNFGGRTYFYQANVAGLTGAGAHDHMPSPHDPGMLRQRVHFYRYLLADAARFRDGCRVTLHRGEGATSFGQADLTWLFYLAPEPRRTWPPLRVENLPWPVTRSGAQAQAEDLADTATITTGTLTVVPDRWGSFGLDAGALLTYAAEYPGDTLTFSLPAPGEGYYRLRLRQIGSPRNASYTLERGGREFKLWTHPVTPSPGMVVIREAESWGTWYMQEGDNEFHFVHTPESWQTGTLLMLDAFFLEPLSRRTNALDAQFLRPLDTVNCRARPEPLGNRWASGEGLLLLEPTAPGAEVTLPVVVEQELAPALLLLAYQAEEGHSFEVLWNGSSLGTVHTPAQEVPFTRRLAWFSLPEVTAGEHRLTLRFQSMSEWWLDCLRLGPPGVLEAEVLPFHTQHGFMLLDTVRPDDPAPQQNLSIRHIATGLDNPLRIAFPALREGPHRLSLWFMSEGGARYRFLLNGEEVSVPPLETGRLVLVDLGVVNLREGLNLLELAGEALIRIDALEVHPAG